MASLASPSAIQPLQAAIGHSPIASPAVALNALAQVRDGVITGEGPTTRGRIHFSRTIDAHDAWACERILIAAGAQGAAVTREEAELLFEINDAGCDREDGGAFDDLFAKAVAHYALAAVGRPVPPRAVALAAATPLASWATAEHLAAVGGRIGIWLEARLRCNRRCGSAMRMLHTLLAGAAVSPLTLSLARVIDAAG